MVTFADSTVNGDFHAYRNFETPQSGNPVAGLWQPDGCNVDPDRVVTTDARTAMSSSFNGLAASGQSTLFVADLSTGAQQTLTGYSLEITGVVPEPNPAVPLGIAALLLAGFARRSMRKRQEKHGLTME